MLTTLALATILLAPSEAPSPAEGRAAAAALLQARLAGLADHLNCEHRFPLLVDAGRDAAAVLGGGAFGAELEELVLRERWRAVTDRATAEERLEDELRRALSDLEFRPRLEAELPAGFPLPTPVREIEVKRYPTYRLARAEMQGGRRGGGAFMRLFRHIQRNDIPMTAPVEVTYAAAEAELREVEMAFLYERPGQGTPGADGDVEVVDVPAMRVASLGCRGDSTDAAVAAARARLLGWIEARGDLEVAGELRLLGYNSPMVRGARRVFEVQLPVRPRGAAPGQRIVIDFTAPGEAERWLPVDDVVMGGRSSSDLTRSADGTCVFSGRVSLENNGGFASVRSNRDDLDLDGVQALSLRVRGDGRSYRLRLRTSDAFDAPSYQVGFDTVAGEWQERSFRIDAFRASWRGRAVPDAPPLDPARVRGLGLIISDEQAGPFRLELASLSVEADA